MSLGKTWDFHTHAFEESNELFFFPIPRRPQMSVVCWEVIGGQWVSHFIILLKFIWNEWPSPESQSLLEIGVLKWLQVWLVSLHNPPMFLDIVMICVCCGLMKFSLNFLFLEFTIWSWGRVICDKALTMFQHDGNEWSIHHYLIWGHQQ